MADYIKQSIERVNSAGYLDELQTIYPLNISPEREIDENILNNIKKAYESKNTDELLNILFTLEKFPLDNPYSSILRNRPDLRTKNPKTIEQISELIKAMDIEKLIERVKQPKASSRQMGNQFKSWLKNQYHFKDESGFNSSNRLTFLKGSDNKLKEYAENKFKIKFNDSVKGFDLLFKKNNKYCFGEAKFITGEGGTQTNQLDKALHIADMSGNKNISTVAVIDGVAWFDNSYLDKIKSRKTKNIMSALLLEKFLVEF
jgi:hypothetical protein